MRFKADENRPAYADRLAELRRIWSHVDPAILSVAMRTGYRLAFEEETAEAHDAGQETLERLDAAALAAKARGASPVIVALLETCRQVVVMAQSG